MESCPPMLQQHSLRLGCLALNCPTGGRRVRYLVVYRYCTHTGYLQYLRKETGNIPRAWGRNPKFPGWRDLISIILWGGVSSQCIACTYIHRTSD